MSPGRWMVSGTPRRTMRASPDGSAATRFDRPGGGGLRLRSRWTKERLASSGGFVELGQSDSTDTPLAVDRLHRVGHRHVRRLAAGRACRVGQLRAAAPACLAFGHRSLPVRVAVCRKAAQREQAPLVETTDTADSRFAESQPGRPAEQLHVNGWIVKPFEIDPVIESVLSYCGMRQRRWRQGLEGPISDRISSLPGSSPGKASLRPQSTSAGALATGPWLVGGSRRCSRSPCLWFHALTRSATSWSIR